MVLLSIFLLTQNVKFLRIEIKNTEESRYVNIEIPAKAVEWLIKNSEGQIKINDSTIRLEVLDSLIKCCEGKIFELQKENEITQMFVYKREFKLEKACCVKIKVEKYGIEGEDIEWKFPLSFLKFVSVFIPDKGDKDMLKDFLNIPFKGTIIKIESQNSRICVSFE